MHYPTDESFLAVEDLSVAFQRYDSTFEQADLKVISDLSGARSYGTAAGQCEDQRIYPLKRR